MLIKRFVRIFLIGCLWIALPLGGAEQPIFDLQSRFHPVRSESGMVVSQEALASRVGAEILAKGGNAIDAAVATGFALAVTLPQAGNIGGGGFMMIYLADEDRTLAVDYRETAPAAAYRDMFLDEHGEVDIQKARFSHQSAGVPGTVAGLVYALEKYGTMSLKQVMAPAIRLATGGVAITYPNYIALKKREKELRGQTASAKYFFHPDGRYYLVGELWRQPDLAWSLKQIARDGADAFYRGKIADRIATEMKRGGGLITKKDLAAYQVIERQPVWGSYRDYRIASMPPPSSGGVHLVQMLNILEGWDLNSLGHNSAAYLHRLVEAMRRAYADRSKYLGDPDFYPVPIAELTDRGYAAKLRKSIDLKHATPSEQIGSALEAPYESQQTTHFSVWDKQGNVVSNTYTINFSFGSGISVDGAGFLLNNEMDDFASKPGTPNAYGLLGGGANAIEVGKRPLSSMTPTLLFKDGKPVMATGSPGGSTIITVVLQILLNTIDFKMNVAEATAAPRIHHQWLPDELVWEQGVSPDTLNLLHTMGHNLGEPRILGRAESITGDGKYLYGISDSRWPGGEAAVEGK